MSHPYGNMRTKEQIKQYQKEWSLKNKERLSLYYKNYYIEKKDTILNKNKIYRSKIKDRKSLMDKVYRESNIDEIKRKQKLYYNKVKNDSSFVLKRKLYRERTKEQKKEVDRLYRINNKEKVNLQKIKYREKNKEYIKGWHRNYQNNRKKNDPEYKVLCLLRTSLYYALKKSKNLKTAKIKELIGCDLEQLKNHLESNFKDGMSWENYTYDGWHVDHIKPLALFNLKDIEEQKKAFNYKNLQPLWAIENISKGKKYHA